MKKIKVEISRQDQKVLYQICAEAMALPIETMNPKALLAMSVVDRYFTPVKVMKIRLEETVNSMTFTLPELVGVKALLDHSRKEGAMHYPVMSRIDLAFHQAFYASGDTGRMLQFRNQATL